MDFEDDIGADVAAAFTEAKAPDAAAAAAATPTPAPETPAGAARDEHGRFAPKPDEAAQQNSTTDQPAAAAPEAQPELIRPPASWSAQAKADFATLPEHIQKEVLKRETDVTKGFEERAAQLKRYEPLEQVIAPHRDRIHMAGVDEATYVRSLIAADEALRGPNRIQAFAQLAQMYGIDPRSFTQPGQSGQQPQAQLAPEMQALIQKVASLEQSLTQQTTQSQQAETTKLQAEIDAFAKDHLYFENVRPAVAALLRTGQATTLAEAYDMACWARPDVRPLLIKEQADKQRAEAEATARAKASNAKQAAGSITGSPAPGAAPAPANANTSIEDDVRAAFRGQSSSIA